MERAIAMLLITAPAGVNGQVAASAEPSGLRDGPHQVVINDVRLWYRVAGRPTPGVPPLVYLHGGPGQGSYPFAALIGPSLERSLRLVYFDQRGSGNSERPWMGAYSWRALIDDLEGLRRELGVQRIALIGHSFGGTLALEYAAAYPAHVSSVVIVSGMWSLPVQGRYQCERIRTRNPALAHAADSVATGPDHNCRWFWSLPAAQRDPLYRALMFPDTAIRLRLDSTVAASHLPNTGELSAALSRAGLSQYEFTAFDKVTMPILVIGGRDDGVADARGLQELARRLAKATFVEYERSGHYPFLDQPDRFVQDVATFLLSSVR